MRTSALLPLCNTSASCDINRSNLGTSTVSRDITTGQCADQRRIKQLIVPPLLFLPHSQKYFFVKNSSYMVCMWTEVSVCAPKIEAPCIYVASCVFEKQKQKRWWYLERLSFPINYPDFQLWTWNRERDLGYVVVGASKRTRGGGYGIWSKLHLRKIVSSTLDVYQKLEGNGYMF
jgi:hypothetical protein